MYHCGIFHKKRKYVHACMCMYTGRIMDTLIESSFMKVLLNNHGNDRVENELDLVGVCRARLMRIDGFARVRVQRIELLPDVCDRVVVRLRALNQPK
jgi:hypothetical protein